MVEDSKREKHPDESDDIWSIPSGCTLVYMHGIRIFQEEKMSTRKRISANNKAIEPTSIDKLPEGYRFGIDVASGNDFGASYAHDFHPSPLMRRLGFSKNPATCSHYHKRYITRWFCADCGEYL